MNAPSRHTTNKDSRIREVTPHPYAITKHRAAGERAGGIDRDDTNLLTILTNLCREPIDEGALPGAGRPRYADELRAPGPREYGLQQADTSRCFILDKRQRAGDCPRITSEHTSRQRGTSRPSRHTRRLAAGPGQIPSQHLR